MAQQAHEAGVGVDLDPGRLDAVGEGERVVLGHIVPGDDEFRLQAGRQRVGAEIGDAAELGERHPLGARGRVDDPPAAQVEAGRVRLEDGARHHQHVLPQGLAGLPGGLAADAGAARRPGAAAIGVASVSPVTTRTCSIGTPTAVATTWATIASVPCPCSVTPIAATTPPCGLSRKVQPSWDEMRAPPTP